MKQIITLSLFLSMILSQSSMASQCLDLYYSQASKAAQMILDAGAVTIMDDAGNRRDEQVTNTYLHCHLCGSNKDSRLDIGGGDADLAYVYLNGKNVGTTVGCKNTMPEILR